VVIPHRHYTTLTTERDDTDDRDDILPNIFKLCRMST